MDMEEPVQQQTVAKTKNDITGGRPLWQYLGLAGLAVVAGGFALYKAYHQWGSKTVSSNGEFDVARAKEMAILAEVAYCSKSAMESWSCEKCDSTKMEVPAVEVCPGLEDKKQFQLQMGFFNRSKPIKVRSVYIGIYEGEALLGFAGDTANFQEIKDMEHSWWNSKEGKAQKWWGDWMWLQESCEDCSINFEIAAEWFQTRKCVKNALVSLGRAPGSKVRITGHGKGGATASLAALDLKQSGYDIDELWTFGAPRFGDSKLAMYMTSQLQGSFWRVTRGRDPWTHLPSRSHEHAHPFPEVHFEVNSKDTSNEEYTICHSEGDRKCAIKHANMAKNKFAMDDHRLYMGVPLGRASSSMCNDNDGRNPSRGGASGKNSSTSTKSE